MDINSLVIILQLAYAQTYACNDMCLALTVCLSIFWYVYSALQIQLMFGLPLWCVYFLIPPGK